MKKIQRLTLDELESCFEILSEEECRNAIGGWCCFGYCLDYLGYDSAYFNLYYGALYGSPEYAGGVDGEYIQDILTILQIPFINGGEDGFVSLQSGDIVAVNNGTHATIYTSQRLDDSGNVIIYGYDPQIGSINEYVVPKGSNLEAMRIPKIS